jgi:uncharacterized metal-binding protein YceD (DUF177 family)
VEKAYFSVPLADLDRGPKEVTWAVPESWLRQTLADTGATPQREGTLRLQLTKTGRRVIVRGELEVLLTMPCVRTLDPVDVDLKPEIFLLLSPAEPSAAQGPRTGGRQRSKRGPAKAGESAGKARDHWAEDPELTDEDAANDSYHGDHVELDRFIREFILLDLPMTPMQKGLHGEPEPAIARATAEPGESGQPPLDPRLAPLAEIASRLRNKKE